MAAPLIAFAVMAGIQLASGYHQANMIREQNRFRRRIDDMNVEQAELDAFEAEQFGYTQQARYQTVVDETLASQRLKYAGEGTEIGYGTAGALEAETKITGMLNQLEIEQQARQKVNGFKREIRNIRLGQEMSTLQAEMDAGATQNAAIMNAGSTMLSGYGKNS